MSARIIADNIFYVIGAAAMLVVPVGTLAQDEAESPDDLTPSVEEAVEIEVRREDEATLIEDPEAQRRARALAARETEIAMGTAETPEAKPEAFMPSGSLEFYASARAHVINNYDVETSETSTKVGDGNSRAGVRAEWEYKPGWYVYSRAEIGLLLFDTYSTRTGTSSDNELDLRLAYVGLDHENLTLTAGKNWSAYYKVAGVTDRFAIFGGSASGTYHAGTAGEASGIGRAKDVFQASVYVNPGEKLFRNIKPFNVNVQYQLGQDIPFAGTEKYDYSYGMSAVLETKSEYALGIAYNFASVPDGRAAIQDAGIEGDATALAISTRMYGNRWYAGLLVSKLNNMQTTDQNRYFNATGVELYAQWEVMDNWWLIGGANALEPDSEDPDVGMYRVRYVVLGGRYSFDSFKRMAYVEYRIDEGRRFDGGRNKDELTIGVRWDFGE